MLGTREMMCWVLVLLFVVAEDRQCQNTMRAYMN